jgi:hypothetical protein
VQKPVQQAPSRYKAPQLVKPRAGIGPGWIIAGVLGGGAILVVTGIVVIGVVGALVSAANADYYPDEADTNPIVRTEEREPGPVLGTGDVQITLRWDAPADLDLHVIDPNQEEIYYSHRSSRSGGQLDVDANPGCSPMMANPVENVFWPYGGAPGGWYGITVVYFADCGDNTGPVDYELTIRLDGQVYDVIRGTIYEVRESQPVTSFTR